MKSLKEMLGQEWIDRRLNMTGGITDPDSGLPTGMGSCELYYANGGSAESIREACRVQTRHWAGKVAQMTFAMKRQRIEGGMLPSDAKRMAEMHGGTWWKASQYYAGVEYEYLERPEGSKMPTVWLMAAVGGDRELAKKVAAPYRAAPPEHFWGHDEIREFCLRHALAEDDAALTALGAKLEPAYAADFPPQLVEFPLGIIQSDPQLLLEGLRKMNTRFKGKWNEKKWRAWYDNPRNRRRRHKTWEENREATKDALFNLRFFLSWWALAWLNIAAWRGMDSVFEDARRFSPWIPIELATSRPA